MTVDKFNERVHGFIWDDVIPGADELSTKCLFGAIEGSGVLRLDEGRAKAFALFGVVGDDGAVDVEQLKTILYKAAEAAGGVLAFKVAMLPVKIPRTILDRFFSYLETGTVK